MMKYKGSCLVLLALEITKQLLNERVSITLVPKVALARENHCNAVFIAGIN